MSQELGFYEAMQEVLQRPAYDVLTGRTVDYQRVILDAIGRAIINILERIHIRTPEDTAYNVEFFALIFVITAAVLLLATAIGVAYYIIKQKNKNAERQVISSIFDDVANKNITLPQLLNDAKQYADTNQFREAVRCYYTAVLISLNDKRTIRVNKSKTNAQLVSELYEVAPALYEPFAEVVETFQQAWFGRKYVSDDRYKIFVARAEGVLDEK